MMAVIRTDSLGSSHDWPAAKFGILLAGILVVGCNRVQDEPGTGARECVQCFYRALIEQDWNEAYSKLDSRSQKANSLEQFKRLAQSYRGNLSFEPEAVHIQSCQERGQEAGAHLVLTGRNADQERRYKDAAALTRTGEGWRIVLSPTFGRDKKR
jgi:hypothetical protein